MEFKNDILMTLNLVQKFQVVILRALQQINVNQPFVSRYRNTSSGARREESGQQHKQMVGKIKAKNGQNSRCSGS